MFVKINHETHGRHGKVVNSTKKLLENALECPGNLLEIFWKFIAKYE